MRMIMDENPDGSFNGYRMMDSEDGIHDIDDPDEAEFEDEDEDDIDDEA